MMASQTFTTDISSETLISRKLRDLCQEMEVTVQEASFKFTNTLDHVKLRFYKTYKNVIEQILNDFVSLKKKFEEYTQQYEQEVSAEVLQKKLIFFRDECDAQYELQSSLKIENQQLKQELSKLREENITQYNVLLKLGHDKLQLRTHLEKVRSTVTAYEESITQQYNKSKKNITGSSSILIESIQRNKQSQSRCTTAQGVNRPRTISVTQHNVPALQEIWIQSIQECTQSNLKSKVNYLEKFIQDKAVQRILENLIFKAKYCDNPNCPAFQKIITKKICYDPKSPDSRSNLRSVSQMTDTLFTNQRITKMEMYQNDNRRMTDDTQNKNCQKITISRPYSTRRHIDKRIKDFRILQL